MRAKSPPGGQLLALVLALVAFALVGAAGVAADDTGQNTQPTVAQSEQATDELVTTQQTNESNNATQAILDAIPESVLEELPDGLVDGLIEDFGDQIPPDITEQLDTLQQLPDSLVESVLLEVVDNIPDEVLNNPDELIEDPPDEIPAILCRANDMEGKFDGGRENWGPTNLNSQIGNQQLTVGTSQLGTVTLFKYPNPSYADQVKHHAFDRREPYYGTDPNAGMFLGLSYTTDDGETDLDWLRDWGPVSTRNPDYAEHVDQEWDSILSDTLVTTFTNETLGLEVTVTNAVPKNNDTFIRDIQIEAEDGSPVSDVEVVSYANFNLVNTKHALIPTQGWCQESKNDVVAEYNESEDAIVYEKPDYEPGLPEETIERAGPEFSIATAMSFGGQSSQHQVAHDAFRTNASADPYELLSNGTTDLPGHDNESGQVSTALTRDIEFEDGQGEATVYFGAASDDEPGQEVGDEAVQKIESTQDRSLDAIVEEKEEWLSSYVEDAPMPENAPENVTALAKRALVSLAQVWDDETENVHGYSGNIIAGAATQAPYGADWIRDGAYFNYVLDRYFGEGGDGKHSWVNQHNRWYKSLQQNPAGECPQHCHDNMQYYDLGLGIVPEERFLRTAAFDQIPFTAATHPGDWAMNYYADGVPAGPLGGEIDETAYGAWTFWDHYAVTGNETYLREIYPAIELVAERLTEDCVDEETGLQCPRPEDDNEIFTQSATGGASVYAGLDASVKAAAEMYQITGNESYAEDAVRYAERRDNLSIAMDKFYWNQSAEEDVGLDFKVGESLVEAGDIGEYGTARMAMPAFVRPLDDSRMKSQLEAQWTKVNASFSGESDAGQYEAKSLIGLGVATYETDDPPVSREQLQRGLEWLADEAARAESTHVMGEAWQRETYADDEVDAAVSQPHIWQQSLNYIAALLAYGSDDVNESDRVGYEAYEEWRRHDAELGTLEAVETTAGGTAETTITVTNDAPVEQPYHVTYRLEGPDGEQYNATETDIGPIGAGESTEVTLSWDTADAPTGEYNATAAVWKAALTDEDGETDPIALANEPTGLPDPELRHISLDEADATVTLQEAPPDDGTDDGTDDGMGDGGTDDDGTDDGTEDGGTDDGTNESGDEDGSGAGFGILAAAIAVAIAGLVARRRAD